MIDYKTFLQDKIRLATLNGFEITEEEVTPVLKPHQRAAVVWAIRGGKRALFESFGLGKTLQQLEICRIVLSKLGGGRGLIVAPLGVRQEFKRDAEMLGLEITFIRRTEDLNCTICNGTGEIPILPNKSQKCYLCNGSKTREGLFITNYESVRDGKLDVHLFDVVSLDEASCLRGFGGTKTFREFMAIFAGDRKTMNERTFSKGVQYRFVATATPSPNEYIELLAYSAFLGIMDVSAAKTRFFKRDSTKADHLTLHPHKEREFWLWVSSWAMFLQKPSDLGFSDDGYELPEKKIIFHQIDVDHASAGADKSGQGLMFRQAAYGLSEAAREKRDTLNDRIVKMQEIISDAPEDHFLIWHDLEAERYAIERALPESISSVLQDLIDSKYKSSSKENFVKQADDYLLSIEAYFLMPKHPEWSLTASNPVDFDEFETWSPQKSKDKFLNAFLEFGGRSPRQITNI
jgi:hypothetical protein